MYVYCCRNIKADMVEHEQGLTTFLLLFKDAPIVRGYDVDPELRPDAELTLKTRLMVEWVTEHTQVPKFRERLREYRAYDGPVLWVCPDRETAERLCRAAARIENNAYFGTIADALDDPFGPIWTDSEGRVSALENPVENLSTKRDP